MLLQIPVWDESPALENPYKGWYHHYYDNVWAYGTSAATGSARDDAPCVPESSFFWRSSRAWTTFICVWRGIISNNKEGAFREPDRQ